MQHHSVQASRAPPLCGRVMHSCSISNLSHLIYAVGSLHGLICNSSRHTQPFMTLL